MSNDMSELQALSAELVDEDEILSLLEDIEASGMDVQVPLTYDTEPDPDAFDKPRAAYESLLARDAPASEMFAFQLVLASILADPSGEDAVSLS